MAEPEYDVVMVQNFAGDVVAFRHICLHANKVPVTISTGETVADLCIDCDQSFQKPGWG